MAITSLSNTSSIVFDGDTIESLPVVTNLALAPTIVKTVDLSIAKIGDIVTYTVVISNTSLVQLTNIPFVDILPAGCTYKEGTFTKDGVAATPTISGQTLSYTIPSISILPGLVTLRFSVTVTGV